MAFAMSANYSQRHQLYSRSGLLGAGIWLGLVPFGTAIHCQYSLGKHNLTRDFEPSRLRNLLSQVMRVWT